MMKKILIATMVLTAVLGSFAFASGQADSTPNIPGPATTGDKLTLSGTVKVDNLIHPVLTSGGKDYYLMIPHRAIYDVAVKDGAQVKIEGYKTTAAPRYAPANSNATYVLVTKATVDGKDYDLTVNQGVLGRGMMGNNGRGTARGMDGRGGMMGGRGGGYRW